jgi:hypothetical protein
MKPNPELAQEYSNDLVKVERDIAKLKDEKKAEAKRLKGLIEKKEGRRDELLDLIEGRQHAQPQLPLTTPKDGKKPEAKADGKADGKKPAPPPLEWKKKGDNLVAVTPLGTYCVEPGSGSGFSVFFTATNGISRRLGKAKFEAEGKDVALRDWLEIGGANVILENAGDGALTGKVKARAQEIDVTPRGPKALPAPNRGEKRS